MIKLFEAFSGYGGASWGLKLANIPYECVGYSEIDKNVIQLYDQNFPGRKNFGDITNLDPKDLPDFDLLTGGFPCTDISIAGNCDLSKGRSTTVYNLLNIAKVKHPEYILLENVKNILSPKFKPFLRSVLSELYSMGYDVSYKLMNSKDYGIPQNRSRVWFVCQKNKCDFVWPEKPVIHYDMSDIYECNVKPEYYLKENIVKYIESKSGIKRINKDFIRINPDICVCQTTRMYASWSGNYIKTEKGYRRFTPKECFRLQGFIGDEINLSGIKDKYLYVAAGNGWDINIAGLILKNLVR